MYGALAFLFWGADQGANAPQSSSTACNLAPKASLLPSGWAVKRLSGFSHIKLISDSQLALLGLGKS